MLLRKGGAFWFSEGNRAPCRLINELEEFRKKEKLARGRTFCVTKVGSFGKRSGKGRCWDLPQLGGKFSAGAVGGPLQLLTTSYP